MIFFLPPLPQLMQQQAALMASVAQGGYLNPMAAFAAAQMQQMTALNMNGLAAAPMTPTSGEPELLAPRPARGGPFGAQVWLPMGSSGHLACGSRQRPGSGLAGCLQNPLILGAGEKEQAGWESPAWRLAAPAATLIPDTAVPRVTPTAGSAPSVNERDETRSWFLETPGEIGDGVNAAPDGRPGAGEFHSIVWPYHREVSSVVERTFRKDVDT